MFLTRSNLLKYNTYQGRKVSKKLSSNKLEILRNFYTNYSYDEQIIEHLNSKNFKNKFRLPKGKFNKINIEIGFGDGEFLLQNAITQPKELFIGIEVYINGIAKVLENINKLGMQNLILSNLNCLYFLQALPNDSIDKIYIINPDPWIKKRHHKRRLINHENIKLFTQITKKRNEIYITTDSKFYLQHIKALFKEHNDFYRKAKIQKLKENDNLFNISRYQRKAMKNGEKIYLINI